MFFVWNRLGPSRRQEGKPRFGLWDGVGAQKTVAGVFWLFYTSNGTAGSKLVILPLSLTNDEQPSIPVLAVVLVSFTGKSE